MSDSDLDSRPTTPLPEAGHDGDSNRPASEERDTPPAPSANPELDMDDADNESELSEVDEAEFAEFDPTTVALEDRPQVGIDEDIARTLKAGKRKRADGDGKKPKEAKRDKKKRARRDDDEDPDGEELDGKRVRKTKKIDGERSKDKPREKRAVTPENEENLTPDESTQRALDRAMDAALKNPNRRRRKKDEVVCLI
jgi:transcription factor SPN1